MAAVDAPKAGTAKASATPAVEVERDERPPARGTGRGRGRAGHAEHRAAQARRRGVVGVALDAGAHARGAVRAEPEVEEGVGEQRAGGEGGRRRAEAAGDRDAGVCPDGEAAREVAPRRGTRCREPLDEEVVARREVAEGGERAGALDARPDVGVRPERRRRPQPAVERHPHAVEPRAEVAGRCGDAHRGAPLRAPPGRPGHRVAAATASASASAVASISTGGLAQRRSVAPPARWTSRRIPGSLSTCPVSSATAVSPGRITPSPTEPAHARHARRARGLAADAGRVHRRLGREQLLVVHGGDHAVGLADHAYRPVPARRIADLDGRRHGLGAHGAALGEVLAERAGERRRAGGLHRGDPRHAVDEAERDRVAQGGAHGGGVAEVAGRKDDPVGRAPAELLEDLEHHALLPGHAVRVDRVDQVHAERRRVGADEGEAAVEVPAHEQGAGAVGERLGELAHGHLRRAVARGGDEHEAGDAGERGIGSERRARVAGARTGHRARAGAAGLGERRRHPAVLERAGGVVSVVLEEERIEAGPPRDRRTVEKRRVALGLADDLRVGGVVEHELAEAPHARRAGARRRVVVGDDRRVPVGPARVEARAQLGAAGVGCGCDEVEEAAARRALGVKRARAVGGAAGGADEGVGHGGK
jgi:hypothetical protein